MRTGMTVGGGPLLNPPPAAWGGGQTAEGTSGLVEVGLHRRSDRHFDVLNRSGHGLADEVELADLVDARGRLFQFLPGQEPFEDAAGVSEADDHHIARGPESRR